MVSDIAVIVNIPATNRMQEAESNARLEKVLRQIAIELGLGIAISARPLPGPVIREYTVPNTVSQAWYLGRAIHLARKAKTSYVQAIVSSLRNFSIEFQPIVVTAVRNHTGPPTVLGQSCGCPSGCPIWIYYGNLHYCTIIR
jgi:DUF917 family protein